MKQGSKLELARCAHCNVAKPHLVRNNAFNTTDFAGGNPRCWAIYWCGSCGGAVLTSAPAPQGSPPQNIADIWPSPLSVADEIPGRAREYLEQAIACIHAPSGAVMLTASAVDSMLKEIGFSQGTLYSRIDEATKQHKITPDMAKWAHEVRLDANDQRHADDNAALPTEADATRVVEFARTLAQLLFVLPAQVSRGRAKSA